MTEFCVAIAKDARTHNGSRRKSRKRGLESGRRSNPESEIPTRTTLTTRTESKPKRRTAMISRDAILCPQCDLNTVNENTGTLLGRRRFLRF